MNKRRIRIVFLNTFSISYRPYVLTLTYGSVNKYIKEYGLIVIYR